MPPDFWPLLAIAVLAAARLVRLLIVDELGRRLITDPLYGFLLSRLPERFHWIADGLHCPWCIGFWVYASVIAAHYAVTSNGGHGQIVWTILTVALATHWAGTHLAEKLGEYHEPQDNDR